MGGRKNDCAYNTPRKTRGPEPAVFGHGRRRGQFCRTTTHYVRYPTTCSPRDACVSSDTEKTQSCTAAIHLCTNNRVCSSCRVRRIPFAQHDFRANNTSDPFQWLWVAILVLSCCNGTKPIATWSTLVFVFVSLGFAHLFPFFNPVELASFCFDPMPDFWAWKLINMTKTLFFAVLLGTSLFQLYFWWFFCQETCDFRISTICCIKLLFVTS